MSAKLVTTAPPTSGSSSSHPSSSSFTSKSSSSSTSSSASSSSSLPLTSKQKKEKAKQEELDRIAAELAAANAQPKNGVGVFEFPNGAIYDGQWALMEVLPTASTTPSTIVNAGSTNAISITPSASSSANTPTASSTTTVSPSAPLLLTVPTYIKTRHGYGTYTHASSHYIGEWYYDTIQGQGTYSFGSGANYTGEFYQNEFHGKGTYRWKNGSVYRGDWKRNKMHGLGSFVSGVVGDRFEGEFVNDRFRNEQGDWIAPEEEQKRWK